MGLHYIILFSQTMLALGSTAVALAPIEADFDRLLFG